MHKVAGKIGLELSSPPPASVFHRCRRWFAKHGLRYDKALCRSEGSYQGAPSGAPLKTMKPAPLCAGVEHESAGGEGPGLLRLIRGWSQVRILPREFGPV